METTLIVGGTSGIGLEVAKQNARFGHRTVILGRSKSRLSKVLDELDDDTVGFQGDANDPQSIREVLERIGKIDYLVIAAAGGSGSGSLADLETEDLMRGFEEKFRAHWTVLKTARNYLAEHASIVLVGAARSRMSDPDSVGLAAINGALDAMIPALARELSPCRINLVAPGVIDTPPWDQLSEDDKANAFSSIARRTLVGRIGNSGEVAKAILDVMRNTYITGTVLEVDGGLRFGNGEK